MNITLPMAAEQLSQAEHIVITAHINPDGDAIGSSLGLMYLLKSMGKRAEVYLQDEVPRIFSFLPGRELIRKPLTDGAKLTPDLCVVLDTALDRTGNVLETIDAPVLNIDHHKTNTGSDALTYVSAERAATCEIIAELARLLKVEMDEDAAMCLYTGLATDTGFFRYANTTPLTMETGAMLIAKGAKPHIVSESVEQKPYEQVLGMAKAMQTMELSHGGRVIGLYLDHALTKELAETEGLVDMIRVVEGAEIAVLLRCPTEDMCRVSMRSKGPDVAKVAASLGGGGHTRAAGVTLKLPFDEAKKAILAAIGQALEP